MWDDPACFLKLINDWDGVLLSTFSSDINEKLNEPLTYVSDMSLICKLSALYLFPYIYINFVLGVHSNDIYLMCSNIIKNEGFKSCPPWLVSICKADNASLTKSF